MRWTASLHSRAAPTVATVFTRHLREHSAYAGATARDTTQCALTGAAAASLWVRLFLVESELSSSIIPGLGPPRHCIDPHSILPLHASIHSGSTILLQRVRGTAVAADCVLTTPCIDCGSQHFVVPSFAPSLRQPSSSAHGGSPRCALSATSSMELHTALLSTKWCVLRVLFLQRLRLPGRSSFLHGWGSLVAALVGVNSLPAHACAAPSRHPGHRERDGCAPCSSRSRSPRRRLIAFARAA